MPSLLPISVKGQRVSRYIPVPGSNGNALVCHVYKNEYMQQVSVISLQLRNSCSPELVSVHVPCAVVCLVGIISLSSATCPQILLYFLTIEIHRIY